MACTTRSTCPMWPKPIRRRCAPSCANPFVRPEVALPRSGDCCTSSGGTAMVDVQEHQSRCGDPANGPWAEADVAQGLERHRQQEVAALADGREVGVGEVAATREGRVVTG